MMKRSSWTICLAAVCLCVATAAAQPGDAERALKEAVRRAPESFEACHRLGEFYLRSNRLEDAIPLLEKAHSLDPTHYANSYDLGLAYFQGGKPSEARAQVLKTLKHKETAELHGLLGDIEDKAGNLVAAAEHYNRAARMEETEDRVLDLGNSLVKLNAFDEAIQIFSYGVGKYPRSGKLFVGMGVARYSRGDFKEAVKYLCTAADLDPEDPRPFLFLGEMYGVDLEQAEEVTRRMAEFVKRHPENARAHFYYAMNLWQGRRGAEQNADRSLIEASLKRAVELDDKLTEAHYELGALYADQGRKTEAIRELEAAVRLNPELTKAHYRLARLYQSIGEKALAAKEIEIHKKLKEREDAAPGAKKSSP
jgi:tetratricopeptide (TPR) repeat protein